MGTIANLRKPVNKRVQETPIQGRLSMHVYQPQSRCQNTGRLIVWFALRQENDPPGRPRPLSEMLSPEICEDFDELERGSKFLSQRMTLSEVDALKSFLGRYTSLTVDELKETFCPLVEVPQNLLWEDLEDFEAVNLDEHPDYDLPWSVRGRVIEAPKEKQPPSRKKSVFTMMIFLLALALTGCSSFFAHETAEPLHHQWSVPPQIPADLVAAANSYLEKAELEMEQGDYAGAYVSYRRAYEITGQKVALWRHLGGLMIWFHIHENNKGNLTTVIASAEVAASPHVVPLSPSYAEQNRKLLEAAKEFASEQAKKK